MPMLGTTISGIESNAPILYSGSNYRRFVVVSSMVLWWQAMGKDNLSVN